jgi:hypothetical protein
MQGYKILCRTQAGDPNYDMIKLPFKRRPYDIWKYFIGSTALERDAHLQNVISTLDILQ